MKKLFIIAPFIFILISECNQANENKRITKWVYKILEVFPSHSIYFKFQYNDISKLQGDPSISL